MRNGISCSEAGKIGFEKVKDLFEERKKLRREKYYEDPQLCQKCGKVLDYEKKRNKFCSHSCCASVNNLGKCNNPFGRNGVDHNDSYSHYNGNVKKVNENGNKCTICGLDTASHKAIYCSRKCFRVGIKKKNDELAEERILNNEHVDKRRMKRFVLKRDGNICSICRSDKWMGQPIPLIMDHIDGNPENNLPSNLRLVCGNCDMQLPTYKGRNFGNGRYSRRKRYSEGKSF